MGKLNHFEIEETKSSNHWDRVLLSEDHCFVCGKPFAPITKLQRSKPKKSATSTALYIGEKDGVSLFRHRGCDCNSEAWIKRFNGCDSLQKQY